MNTSFEDMLNKLNENNIRLSHQRLKILEYLAENRCHPTVDKIYNELHKDFPTLSKTTVYNTLNLLTKINIVRIVNIEDNETRYDICTENHGHFKCESCGRIYDFSIDIDSFTTKELDGFKINEKDIYFKGICPKCIKN
ncbi:transcriptional repressor [Schnuerera sp. xch1]|uniref:Fur family transcriptional regulator n=1 Tax=Schnuerera sp. xch1 TaxID=2874283 RepID=UPI001CBF846A|nr:Fur family transcriptional regulator [Schnuerera sp. xch1]MBZ2174626.1 transcriptional repressor [Schnuerera sp. xch1]